MKTEKQEFDRTFANHVLEGLSEQLKSLPSRYFYDARGDRLFQAIHSNYMDLLKNFRPGGVRRVFLFLGSNLGNFKDTQAISFLRLVRGAMAPGDAFLVGLDLKKDPRVIRAAYNDAGGHTRDFNLNLLARINRELGGDFDLESFEHVPLYDPASGIAQSNLRSKVKQKVRVAVLDKDFHFHKGEDIHMEVSQKYDEQLIGELATASGFVVERSFVDSQNYFTDQVWV
jgi:L-histidine N-alpha-methyltransferase